MDFHSALAESESLDEACEAIASELRRRLGTGPVDLMVVFASPGYGADLDRLPVLLQELVGAKTLVGCTGAGLLHETTMSDRAKGISVLAGRLDGAQASAAVISNADLPHADASPAAWRKLLPPMDEVPRGMLVIGEPFQCDMRALLAGLDFVLPDVPKVGGLASGSQHPDGNALFYNRQRVNHGAVVLLFSGNIVIEPAVAQGCRPIGKPGKITDADRNRLASVDDKPVREFIETQLQSLTDSDAFLANGSPLFLGIQSDPFSVATPTAGDFLVRNVISINEAGHLIVGEHLSVGRSVQLHLRDRSSGIEDLQTQLELSNINLAQAALMFRCIGRQGNDHEVLAELAPNVPMAGCTCNGEVGPVAGITHMHGYTASCLLIREGQAV